MIAMGDSGLIGYEGDEETCSSSTTWSVSGSLGTLTESGEIITHDHVAHSGVGGTIEFGRPANNPIEAAEYMSSWPCITLTGAYGSVIIKGEDIKTSSLKSVQGTLIIDSFQTSSSGDQISLHALGRAVQSYSEWDLSQDARVWSAHMPFQNSGERFLIHDVEFFELIADTERGLQGYEGRMSYFTLTVWVPIWEDRAELGDSGGGVFSPDGRLIGVNLAVLYGDYFINREFIVVFVPL